MSDHTEFIAQNANALAKMAVAETDWREEAQMYANALGKVKEFCERKHDRSIWTDKIGCECQSCETRRRVLRIIADGLK